MKADSASIQTIYRHRFEGDLAYRDAVWSRLCRGFFQQYVAPDSAVLDLGCGYGQFINHIRCGRKWAMDVNPDAARFLKPEVQLLAQDCAAPWTLAADSLDIVFTSNFFEHLPSKAILHDTLVQVRRCLKPGGRLIALGPNIKFVGARYWDFWDHHLPLTEQSLAEGLQSCGLTPASVQKRFLPYTMSRGVKVPAVLVSWYVHLPWLWLVFGEQFLVIAAKDAGAPSFAESP